MTRRTGFWAALAFVPLAFTATSASAAGGSYSGLCADALMVIYDEIQDATYLSKKNADWNKTSLVVKLDSAEGKLADSKFGEAIDYLQEISDKATGWADLAKPKLDDATGINRSVSAAIGCVTSAITQN